MKKVMFVFITIYFMSVEANAQSQILKVFLKYWDEAYDVGKVVTRKQPKYISVGHVIDDFSVQYPHYTRSSYEDEVYKHFNSSYKEILKRRNSTKLKVEIAPYVKKKNIEIYNKNLMEESNSDKVEKLLKEFYDIQFKDRLVKEDRYHLNKYKSYGKDFGTRGMKRKYELKMQYVLKKFGFYRGEIDGLFGSKSWDALKKMKDYLGVDSYAKMNFTTEGVTVNHNVNKSVKTVEKVLTSNHTELNALTTLCVSRKEYLTLTIEINGLAITLKADSEIELKASKNGRTYSISTKKEQNGEITKGYGPQCKLEKVCISHEGLSVEGSCKGIEATLNNLKSFSISGGGRYVNIPVN